MNCGLYYFSDFDWWNYYVLDDEEVIDAGNIMGTSVLFNAYFQVFGR